MKRCQFSIRAWSSSAPAHKFTGNLLNLLGLLLGSMALAACASASVLVTPTPANDKLAEILARGTLVVATDAAYPPQSELKAGASRAGNSKCASTEITAAEMTGFDIEVAAEIARRLGVEPCFVSPDWTLIVSGGWADRWDISVGSMNITPERVQVLYFPQPYYTTPAVFFVHKDNTTFSQPGDLSGQRVGVCVNCSYEAYLQGTLTMPGQKIDFKVKDAIITGYDAEPAEFEDLIKGDGLRLDAVLTNLPTGQNLIQGGAPIKQLGEPVFLEYLSTAVDKKSDKDPVGFVQKVSDIIRQMHSDGTLLKLSQQYFGVDLTSAASQFNPQTLGQLP